MTPAFMLELASLAWRDAIEASHEGQFEDAAHLADTAIAIEEAAKQDEAAE